MVFRFLDRFRDSDGNYKRFTPDDTPMVLPVGFKRPETLAEQVARLVRSHEFTRHVESQGFESFEESDDFAVDDGYDQSSPYEDNFDLAAIAASKSGIVHFDEGEAIQARNRVNDAVSKHSKRGNKRNSDSDATNPPEEGDKSVDTQ